MKTDHDGGALRPDWNPSLQQSERRERVLTVIRDSTLPISLSDIARVLLEQEMTQVGATGEDGSNTHHVRQQLHHVDLPKLQDAGLIEYDTSRNIVR